MTFSTEAARARHGGGRPWRWLPLLSLLAAASPLSAAKTPKTDVIELWNGDHLTGEVKELLYGRLRYKTDDMGTVDVEWLKVEKLTSSTVYEVELADARRFVGSLEARGDAKLAVVGDHGVEVLDHADLVRITRLDAGFWKRLEGSFDLGLTYTQADDTTQFNFDLELEQRRPGPRPCST
jgi:hypothetical protein